MAEQRQSGSKPIWYRRKLFVLVIAAVLIASGTFVVWNQFLRNWTMDDIAAAVTDNVTAPGFDHSLAGKTVTVKGTVTEIVSNVTTLGTIFFVELDDFVEIRLVYWDQVQFELGDRVKARVSFEWSCYNEESHVYSPQLTFPALGIALGMGTIFYNYSLIRDVFWTPSWKDGDATLTFDWVPERVPLDICNSTLSAGENSWALDYVEALGPTYGIEIDQMSALSLEASASGHICFNDSDGDGNFSTGDSITLKNLTRPDCESGVKCYRLDLYLGPITSEWSGDGNIKVFIPLLKQGIFLEDPFCNHYAYASVAEESSGFRMSFEFSTENMLWSDLCFTFYFDFNCSDAQNPQYVTVYPNASGLDTGTEASSVVPVTMGDSSWTINVTDAEGDGILGAGDRMTLWTDQTDGVAAVEYLCLFIVFEPDGTSVNMLVVVESPH